jgi:hypothetical protein
MLESASFIITRTLHPRAVAFETTLHVALRMNRRFFTARMGSNQGQEFACATFFAISMASDSVIVLRTLT